MFNDFFISGVIRKIHVSTPRDPKKGASAIMLVQWGPTREQSGGSVDFINAGNIRIPNYRFPKLQERLKVGQTVKVTGHIQGVVKVLSDEHSVSVELVADRVIVLEEAPGASEPAAAPAPVAAVPPAQPAAETASA